MSEEAAKLLKRAREDPVDPDEALAAAAELSREVDWDVARMIEESEDG
jgi:hypothetical protein